MMTMMMDMTIPNSTASMEWNISGNKGADTVHINGHDLNGNKTLYTGVCGVRISGYSPICTYMYT